MQVTMTPTDEIVTIDGVQCRIWRGVTANGIRVFGYIHRMAVRSDKDLSEFEKELIEKEKPMNVIVAEKP